MKTMVHHRIEIVLKTGIINSKIGATYNINEAEIVAENNLMYCLDDENFTTVRKKKTDYSASVDRPSIHHYVNDNCWGTVINYNLYTFKKKKPSTIKGEIARYIDDKFTALCNIDLSFLDE